MSNTTYFPRREQMQTAYFSNRALSWCSNEKMISRRKSQVYWVLVPVLCMYVCAYRSLFLAFVTRICYTNQSFGIQVTHCFYSLRVIDRSWMVGTYHSNRHIISNDNQNSSKIFTQRSLTTHDSEIISYFRWGRRGRFW